MSRKIKHYCYVLRMFHHKYSKLNKFSLILAGTPIRMDDRPLRRITLHDKRRVCIQRDWTENRCIRFQEEYPLDLSNMVCCEQLWDKMYR